MCQLMFYVEMEEIDCRLFTWEGRLPSLSIKLIYYLSSKLSISTEKSKYGITWYSTGTISIVPDIITVALDIQLFKL